MGVSYRRGEGAAMHVVRATLWLSIAVAVFLAFGWPSFFGTDPASRPFEMAAKGTLVVFLVSLAAALVLRLRTAR